MPCSPPDTLPGVVSEPKSQIPQERESHAGQQERFPPQILLRGRDCGGAARRAPSCSATHRLSLLGDGLPVQVNGGPALPRSAPTRSSAVGHVQSCRRGWLTFLTGLTSPETFNLLTPPDGHGRFLVAPGAGCGAEERGTGRQRSPLGLGNSHKGLKDGEEPKRKGH